LLVETFSRTVSILLVETLSRTTSILLVETFSRTVSILLAASFKRDACSTGIDEELSKQAGSLSYNITDFNKGAYKELPSRKYYIYFNKQRLMKVKSPFFNLLNTVVRFKGLKIEQSLTKRLKNSR